MNGRTFWLLLSVALLTQASRHSTQTDLRLYLLDSETGGLGLAASRADELIGIFEQLITYAPVAGALLACVVGLRVLLLVGCGIGTLAAVVLTQHGIAMAALGLIGVAVSCGLLVPAIYLLVARQFVAGDDDRRFAAFALLFLSTNSGALFGSLAGGLLHGSAGWPSVFLASAVLGAGGFAMAVPVRSPAVPEPPGKTASTNAVRILAACLALTLLSLTLTSPEPGSELPTIIELWTMLAPLPFLALAATSWLRRAHRAAAPDVLGKVALAAVALTLALALQASGDEPTVLPLAGSTCTGVFVAWITPVGTAVAATMFGGRATAVGLAAWLLVEPLASDLVWTTGIPSASGPWPGAAGALIAAALLLLVRRRTRP